MTSYVFLTVGGGAGHVTSLIVFPYIREQTINDTATVKNREGVFTHTSPHSSAPVTDRGTPAAIRSAGPAGAVTELRAKIKASKGPHLALGPQFGDPCSGSTVGIELCIWHFFFFFLSFEAP